jgi:HEAT repeat protein
LTKERVVPFIGSDDDEIRCLAISVLGGLGASKYLPQLSELSQHPDKTTRHAVIRALGRIKDERCLPILTEALSDDDAQLRRAAAMALGQIPGEKARSVLMKITKCSDKRLARITAKALHSAGSERKSSELRKKRLAKIRGTEEEGELQFDVSLPAAMRTLPEDREYTESELTKIIAQTCSDYSRTRRLMVMDEPNNLMARTAGIFRMTNKGRVIWRVERFIGEHYING